MEDMNKKYKLFQRDAFTIIALVLFTLFFGMILAVYLVNIPDTYAVGSCADGWQVGTTQVINCHGVCENVGKTSGSDFFVPTATAAEWTSFRNNPATNATIGTCVVATPAPSPQPHIWEGTCVWPNECAEFTSTFDPVRQATTTCWRSTTGLCVDINPTFPLPPWGTCAGLQCRGGILSNYCCNIW